MKLRLTLLFVLLTAALTACNFSLAEDLTPPPGYVAPTAAPAVFPASAPDPSSGAAIFAEKCAPCHGTTGQGDGPQAAKLSVNVPALGSAEVAAAAAPAQWYTIVTQGNMPKLMPPFSSLSDQQRWDVVAYALSLSTPAEQIQAGQAKYATACVECHGADGKLSQGIDLTSQEALANLSQNDISNAIQNGKMPGMPPVPVTKADADAIAAYVRTFTFGIPQPVALAPETASTPEGTPTAAPDSAAAPTPTTSNGTISGTVINGSGGQLPAGLTAILHAFEHDTQTQQFNEGQSRETTLDTNGSFSFADVPMLPTSAYYVSVEFSGTTYESAPALPGQDGQTEYDLPITIFETTTDMSGVSISTAHLLLDYSQPGKIQVVEFYIISNPGKQSVVAAEPGGAVLKVSLPKGYENLQFESGVLGERYIQTADGFGDTVSIPPTGDQAEYSLVFAFDMPYTEDKSPLAFLTGQKFELSQQFPLAATSVNLLVPLGVKAEGANLSAGKTQDMGGGVTYQLYNGGAVEAGKTLSIKFSGSPQAGAASTTTNSNQNLLIGIGALGVVLILAGVFLYWRDRQKQAEEDDLPGDEEPDEDEELEQDEIIDAIIALDDQYKAGNLSEESYTKRRGQLKSRLKG